MKIIKIAALAALPLLSLPAYAATGFQVTEFRGSREAVRAYCLERGLRAEELKSSTTCVIRRSGVEITCDNDQQCIRKAPRFAFEFGIGGSGGGNTGGGGNAGNGNGGSNGGGIGPVGGYGTGTLSDSPGYAIGGGYSSGGNGGGQGPGGGSGGGTNGNPISQN